MKGKKAEGTASAKALGIPGLKVDTSSLDSRETKFLSRGTMFFRREGGNVREI